VPHRPRGRAVRIGCPSRFSRIGALDADQSPVAIEIAEAERAQLAETEPGSQGDVEEVDVKQIPFVSERFGLSQLDERGPDCLCVGARDLGAGEALRGW
jgi:hypothetical protein